MARAGITQISTYLPNNVIQNEYLEKFLNRDGSRNTSGVLERIFGITERRFAKEKEQVSDLATSAGKKILKTIDPQTVDFMIFASACSDLIEPATSNIVQEKLGLKCPVMDVKNACNSFVSAFQTADAFIQTGMYKKILIVTGEKLSDTVNLDLLDDQQLKTNLASYSFGDAGSAALIEPMQEARGLRLQKFMSIGKHWNLCTVKAGGSLFPSSPEKRFFEGETAALKRVIEKEATGFIQEAMQESGWKKEEIRHVFTHQVSRDTFKAVSKATGIPLEKHVNVFKKFGNTAAASIPLALHEAFLNNELEKGDKILLVGLAAGISISMQFLIW